MQLHRTGRLALLLTTSALGLVAAAPVLAAVAPQAEAPRRFDVPSGPAGAALNAFAGQADIQLLYPYAAVADETSPGLRGVYAPREALRRLIRDLPLVIASDDGRVVTLRARSAASTDDQAMTLEEVVVTGQRYQSREEVANRRAAVTVVDTLTQDDTGDLADQSLAEALRRIPGVSTVYDEDEGSLITIRGIQPDWNIVTVDGLALASVGTGGAGRRQVDLALIPGQSSRTAEVYKTFTADLDAAAVGGVLNIVPRSAYDRRRPFFLLDVYANNFSYNDVPGFNSLDGDKDSPWGGGFNLAFARRFGGDGQFGLSVTAGFQQKQRDQTAPNTPTRAYFTATGAATTPDNPNWNGLAVPDQFVVYDLTNRLRNGGGSVRLEHRPNDAWNSSLMLFAYTQDESETRNANQLQATDRPENMTATGGSLRVRDYRIGYRFHTYDRATRGAQFHTTWRPDEASAVDFRAGYSLSSYKDFFPNAAYGYVPNTRLFYDTTGFTPTFTLADPAAYADGRNFVMKNVAVAHEEARGELSEARLDYARNAAAGDLGWGVQTGVLWRAFRLNRDTRYENYVNNGSTLNGLTVDPRYTPMSWPYPATWLDGRRVFDEILPTLQLNAASSATDSRLEDFKYRESISAAYAQASFATERLNILAGLRYDHSDSVGYAPQTLDGVLQPGFAEFRGEYDNLLPSANLTYRFTDDLRLKASYSQTIGRPNPRDLAKAEVRDDDERTITRGNPDIRPRRSDNFDLAIERYFDGQSGLISLSAFHKAVEDDIFVLTTALEIDGLTYSVKQPMNAEESSLQGLEFNFINESISLPGPLADNLGVSFNVTRLWGETVYQVKGVSVAADRQPFQSDWLANAAIFYALPRGGELRLAANYQSEFVEDFGAQPWLMEGWDDYLTWDFTARHQLTDHLILKFQARNITDENRVGLLGENLEYKRRELEFGRAFYLNLVYKL